MNPTNAESYQYYFLAPVFCSRFDEEQHCEIYNFKVADWEKTSNSTLKRTIQIEGEHLDKNNMDRRIQKIAQELKSQEPKL